MNSNELASESSGIFEIKRDPNAPILTIAATGEELVRIGPDGKITYGANYTPDEAAKAFWSAVVHFIPVPILSSVEAQQEIERLRAALKHIGTWYWPGSVELEREGDYPTMIQAVQKIAWDALGGKPV